MDTIHSALTWAAIGLLILFWLPWMGFVRLFDRDPARYRTGRELRRLGSLITRINPAWHVRRSGSLPADMRNPYVIVCNHQSNGDPPVVSTLPCEMKWVGKASLFRIPVAGWLMRLAGDIPIERADPTSRAAVLLRAREVLEHRCSVMFMPEGTRSVDGRVRRFQDGAFRLAIEMGLPLLPIALDGTAATLPKNGWKFGPANIRLHVFEPIPTEGLTIQDAPALREQVRQSIVDKIAEWRGTTREDVDGAPATGKEDAKSTREHARARSGG